MPGGGPDTACTARGRNKLIYTKKCTDACHTAAFLQSVAIRVGGTHAQLPESAASQSVPRPFSSLNFRTYEPPGETATTAWRGMVSLATGGYRGATDFAQSPQAAFAFMMLAVCQTAWTLAAIWMVGMHGRTWFTGDSQKKLSAAGKCERREAMRSRHAQSERAIGVNAAKQVPRPASMSSSTADLLQCAGSCTCEEMRAATWRALETIGGELTSEMAKEGCVDEPERVMLFVRSVQQSTASLTCRHCLQS